MLTFTSVHFGISDVRCYSDGRTTYSSCWPPTALPLLIHFASSTVFFGSWSFVVCNDRITWLADLLTYLRTQKRRWMLFFLWIFIWPRIMEGWCRCCRPLSCSCWSGNSLSAVTVWLVVGVWDDSTSNTWTFIRWLNFKRNALLLVCVTSFFLIYSYLYYIFWDFTYVCMYMGPFTPHQSNCLGLWIVTKVK